MLRMVPAGALGVPVSPALSRAPRARCHPALCVVHLSKCHFRPGRPRGWEEGRPLPPRVGPPRAREGEELQCRPDGAADAPHQRH
ncbi:hypothetical protein GQ53DRAFT_750271 [Thozetella sp. PMI_491]|nr:hypothetical protein GQ53DRAFT_750271 [Thozetella sp. PMI_491]